MSMTISKMMEQRMTKMVMKTTKRGAQTKRSRKMMKTYHLSIQLSGGRLQLPYGLPVLGSTIMATRMKLMQMTVTKRTRKFGTMNRWTRWMSNWRRYSESG